VTRPSAAVPDVPTFDSQGVKNFEDVFWYGVVAPAGLPPEIAARMQKILADGFLADPGREKMRKLDVEPVMSTPQQFARTMADDTARWKALAERLGLKPE
jgi:tripartite-type tricarboxylate transporter receptor subunit TctC